MASDSHLGPGDVRWPLTGAITVAFVTIALLIQTVQNDEEFPPIFRTADIVILAAGMIIGVLGISTLGTVPLLLSTIALMLAPVFFSVWLWIKRIALAGSQVDEAAP